MTLSLGSIVLAIIVIAGFAAIIWAVDKYLSWIPVIPRSLLCFLLVVICVIIILSLFGVVPGIRLSASLPLAISYG